MANQSIYILIENSHKPIVVEQQFNSPIEQVWAALTKCDHMKRWFFGNIPAFEPKVGFETIFDVQVEDKAFRHIWKVFEVDHNHKLVTEWRYDGYSGSAIVKFELTRFESHTWLRLTSTVMESFPGHVPEFRRESGVEGWNHFINKSLKNYLENNQT